MDGTVRIMQSALDIVPEVSAEARTMHNGTRFDEPFDVAVERIRDGDTRPHVMRAFDEGREKGRRMAQPAVERMRWDLHAVGMLPSVPHYLAGCERTMFRPAAHADETAPLKLWIGASPSWQITEAAAIERGAVLAGIVDAITAVRPVELWLYMEVGAWEPGEGIRLAWRADPRDGSRLAAIMGHTWTRGILIRWASSNYPDRPRGFSADPATIRAHMQGLIADSDLLVRQMDDGGGGTADVDLAEFLASAESTR